MWAAGEDGASTGLFSPAQSSMNGGCKTKLNMGYHTGQKKTVDYNVFNSLDIKPVVVYGHSYYEERASFKEVINCG